MRNNDEDFHLQCLRVKGGLRRKRIPASLTIERLNGNTADQALSITVCALGDSPLRAIQERSTAKEAWDILHDRYDAKKLVNKMIFLNGSLKMRFSKRDDMGDHISFTETKFSRLAYTEEAVSELLKVAIFIFYLSHLREYAAVSASINTITSNEMMWKYVMMMFTEEQCRQSSRGYSPQYQLSNTKHWLPQSVGIPS